MGAFKLYAPGPGTDCFTASETIASVIRMHGARVISAAECFDIRNASPDDGSYVLGPGRSSILVSAGRPNENFGPRFSCLAFAAKEYKSALDD